MCLTNTNGQTRSTRANNKYTRRVDFSLHYHIRTSGQTPEIKLRVNLPQTIPDIQRIISTNFSPQPTRVFTKNGNKYADFVFHTSPKRLSVKIDIKADLFVRSPVTMQIRPGQKLPKPPDLDEYLKHERFIEKNHPLIQQIAKDINGQSETEIIQNIYEYVTDNMTYDTSCQKAGGAVKAVRDKKGKCIDYSDLFVALCRAKHIPARVVAGYTTRPKDNRAHSWVEVYIQNRWITIDPTYNINAPSSSRKYISYNLGPDYIYFTHTRNDRELGNFRFYFCEYKGKKVSIKNSIEFKQPFSRPYKDLQHSLPEHIRKRIMEIRARNVSASRSHHP